MPDKPFEQRRRPNVPDISDDEPDRESTKIRTPSNRVAAPMGRDRPFLIVIGGASAGEMYAISQKDIIIGRARSSTIRFDDDGVSRRHAKLVCLGSEVHIDDLGSANGTFVNGEQIRARRALRDGDKITLGSITILKFTYSDDLDETFQRRMFEAALRDGLTVAYNKRYLLDRLEKELVYARRHKEPLSLLMLDIDHFKNVNDTFGHPAGDAVLIKLTKIAVDTLRKEDVFARYGGEEFCIVCRGIDTNGARIAAERLRRFVAAARTDYDGATIGVTVSIGIAGFPEMDVATSAQLIAAADSALYEAKRAGRNRVVIASGT